MEEEVEEASPNRANAQGGAGEKSRIRCVGSVAPRVRVTVQQPAHAQPFCHSYAGSERTPPHVDGATKP